MAGRYHWPEGSSGPAETGRNADGGSASSTKVQHMAGPVLLAVEDDAETLREIERELLDRYARHYRVRCLQSPTEAQAWLAELASAGESVALILAGQQLSGMAGSELLDQARHLHPHAKRALVIEWGTFGLPEIGRDIFDSIAHGRIDHYVLRPSPAPDELFHNTISGLLLEWAEAGRSFPFTVHVVGESWSGRAYELRNVLVRCAIPHSFTLADSTDGRALGGRRGQLGPASPDRAAERQGPRKSQQRRDRDRRRLLGDPGAQGFRSGHRRRRAHRTVGRGLRRLRGFQHLGRRRRRHRGAGHVQFADPQLPRLPAGDQRPAAGAAGVRAGLGVRRQLRVHAAGHRSASLRRLALGQPLRLRPRTRARDRAGDGRQLSPDRPPGIGGTERHGCLVRRPQLRSSRHGGAGRLRPRRRQLRRTGRALSRPVRPARDAGGARRFPRRRDVALPHPRDRSRRPTSPYVSAARSWTAAAMPGWITWCCATR